MRLANRSHRNSAYNTIHVFRGLCTGRPPRVGLVVFGVKSYRFPAIQTQTLCSCTCRRLNSRPCTHGRAGPTVFILPLTLGEKSGHRGGGEDRQGCLAPHRATRVSTWYRVDAYASTWYQLGTNSKPN